MQVTDSFTETSRDAALHRASWKKALSSVFGAAWRLHHYRDVRTRMLRDALCVMDCSESAGRCDDE